MKNLLKAISYKKKYGKVAGQLIELRAERDALQEEIRELNFQNISLELEVKRQAKIAQNTREAAVLIETRNRQLEKRNNELREENLKLRFGKIFLANKEVMNSEQGTQSNDCGA